MGASASVCVTVAISFNEVREQSFDRIFEWAQILFVNNCFRASEVSFENKLEEERDAHAMRGNKRKRSGANTQLVYALSVCEKWGFDCLIPWRWCRKKQTVSNILFTCVHSIECVIHTDVVLLLRAIRFSLSNFPSCRQQTNASGTRKTCLCVQTETHTLRIHHNDNIPSSPYLESIEMALSPVYYSHFRLLLPPPSASHRICLQILGIICGDPNSHAN